MTRTSRNPQMTRGLGLALLVLLLHVRDGLAQDSIVWSEPRLLSNPAFVAGPPALATDAAGNVHVMWAELMDGDLQVGEGDALVYTRWDGEQWTWPLDVLATPGGAVEQRHGSPRRRRPAQAVPPLSTPGSYADRRPGTVQEVVPVSRRRPTHR